MSPLESATTLPCSLDSARASSSMFFSISDLKLNSTRARRCGLRPAHSGNAARPALTALRSSSREAKGSLARSEEHTSELQSLRHLVCRLLLEKTKTATHHIAYRVLWDSSR